MEEEMSKASIQLVYEGPVLQKHLMDVQELAPALLAFGDLCTETNRILNKERTHVKVLIKSDFKRGSFPVDLEVVQSIIEHLSNLFKDPRVMTAKELLEWLGIIGAGTFTFFKYLKIRKGREIESIEYIKADQGKNTVNIQFKGDNNTFNFPQDIYELGENEKIIQSCKKIVKPVQQVGIDSMKFKEKEKVCESINKCEANAIDEIGIKAKKEEIIKPQIINARLTVHTIAFDVNQPKWKFRYGNEIISVDVTETTIREDTLKRGHVNVGDAYSVQLEITERKTETGNYVNDFKITKVVEFSPGPYQPNLSYRDKATNS